MFAYSKVKNSFNKMVQLFMTWIDENVPFFGRKEVETPRGLLVFLDAAGSRILEAGFFFTIAWTKWHRSSCADNMPLKKLVACSWQAILPCIMVGVIGLVYYLSRHSAKVELAISEKVFPAGRAPKQWTGPSDPVDITISVIFFFAFYLALAWFSDRIRVVSLIMLGIACIDFNTQRLIRDRVKVFFKDSNCAPSPEDRDYVLICQRRTVVEDYIFKRPHLWKEAGRIIGCIVAAGFAFSGRPTAAYLVLISTLLINEIITWNWRTERHHRLSSLMGDQDKGEEQRTQVRRQKSFSLLAWLASILYVVLAAYVARREGTFWSRSVTLGFVNHGGMWGDLLILPWVNGLIVPYLPRLTGKLALIAGWLLALAIAVTLIAHKRWAAAGKALGTTDFIFPSHATGIWHLDLSVTGYLHIIYMSVELTIIFAYVVSLIPVRTIYWISALLTVHVVLGQVQPGWYSTGTIWNVRTLASTFFAVLLLWIVALFKVRRSERSSMSAII